MGRLFRPSLEKGERAMILETRKYAYRNSENIRNRKLEKNGFEETEKNEGENNCGSKKETNSDENNSQWKAEENVCTNYVMCTYYSTILELREEASKYGLRRACVLLGENGTYVRVYVHLWDFFLHYFFVLRIAAFISRFG